MKRIRTAARVRPFSHADISMNAKYAVNCQEPYHRVTVEKSGREINCSFDFLFDESKVKATAEDYFQQIMAQYGRSIIGELEDGHNVLYIALGQNAGGKTYTLFGEEQTDGLIARIVGELIDRNNTKYSLHIEASEFYLDSYRNLLPEFAWKEPGSSRQGELGTKFETTIELNKLLQRARKNMIRRSNCMNILANNSHVQIVIQLVGGTGVTELAFLDLAGKERLLNTGVSKQVFKQVVGINKSLGSLEKCLQDITAKREFIPFRGSKLTQVNKTRLLSSTLYLMFNISSSSLYSQETLETLRLAAALGPLVS